MKIDPALLTPSFVPTRAAPSRTQAGLFVVAGEAAPPKRPEPPVAVARMAETNLIAAIAAPDDRRQRRQGRQRHAAGLLDRLEGLLRGLALGRLESELVEGLGRQLREGGEASDDPVLESLVEAVELRAAVEMAKLKALKRSF